MVTSNGYSGTQEYRFIHFTWWNVFKFRSNQVWRTTLDDSVRWRSLISDQYRNAMRVESAGYGKFLDFTDITHDTLFKTLNEMLMSDKYSTKAKEISTIFGENQVHPMDEFIWWVEYVIKFRGAKHLKSVAADMSLFVYLSLDVILFNLITLLTVFVIFYRIVKLICLRKKNIKLNKKQQ